MSKANENKIDLEVLEGTVAEATGSEAMGRFTRLAFEAALGLRVELIREQTRNAMRRHQTGGRRMSSRLPYGWRNDPDDDARMLPDEDERHVIDVGKDLKAEGLSLRKIAQELTDRGIKPRPVKKKLKGRTVEVNGDWQFGTIRNILNRVDQTEKINKN
jgi:hypothetical protein